MICPEKRPIYKGERGKWTEKLPPSLPKSKWVKIIVLSHEGEVFPYTGKSDAEFIQLGGKKQKKRTISLFFVFRRKRDYESYAAQRAA